jgi:hypothetical protein
MPRSKAKKKRHGSRGATKRGGRKQASSVTYILETGNLLDLRKAKRKTAAYLNYFWNYYSELAYQRSQIRDELHQALNEACTKDYKFQRWQRAVRYKYSLDPLSTGGSVRGIGSRFNIGEDFSLNLPCFSALYLARDKDTALQETLGQVVVDNSELSPREIALTSPQSETIVSVSGQLETVFDIRTSASLRRFTNLIKNFKLSRSLIGQARRLGERAPELVTVPSKLRESLVEENWRAPPRLFDVPSNSQIFGHLVFTAGIEGVLFPSKLTGKNCLAIFPQNFVRTSSFVELDDPVPQEVEVTRIDSSNIESIR